MCVMSVVWCLFRFVAKVRSLDPSYRDVMPWQPRAYSRKRGREGGGGGGGGKVQHEPQAKKLFSPLLAGEKVKGLPSEGTPMHASIPACMVLCAVPVSCGSERNNLCMPTPSFEAQCSCTDMHVYTCTCTYI